MMDKKMEATIWVSGFKGLGFGGCEHGQVLLACIPSRA